jgi:uncharacterized phage-associated protein
MAITTAQDVAKFFISSFQKSGDPVTNLKLQKLLYYAQGWYLAFTESPLFEERIEAWAHGPVVPPVYGSFKQYQWNPITEDVVEPNLPESVTKHLEEVMEAYGVHGAYYLERLTHQEQPWIEARSGLEDTLPSNTVITFDAMKRFFKEQGNVGNS